MAQGKFRCYSAMLSTSRTGGELSNARLLGGVLIQIPPFEKNITEQEGTCYRDLHTSQGDSASMSCRNIEATYLVFRKQRLAISYQSPKALNAAISMCFWSGMLSNYRLT